MINKTNIEQRIVVIEEDITVTLIKDLFPENH